MTPVRSTPESEVRSEAGAASGAALASGEGAPGLVLLVDDEPLLLRALRRILRGDHHEVALASTSEEVEPVLHDPELAVVLLDLVMGRTNGLDILDHIKRERPEIEVIVMTGHASIESAVGCMRRGAFDYLSKPFDDVHRVRMTVRKALERRRLVLRNRELEQELRDRSGIPELVGSSPGMRALTRTIRSLRYNESNVLIRGESGTGKELVARALHATSPRAGGPFVPVDCGALPESIIESELFGNEKGAYTGAPGAPGLFRMANRGTLFLDEIGEVPAPVQAKLLRTLQEKEVRPVGAAHAVAVDIRIIAATHRDLEAMVEAGQFRMDLFYRLNVVRLKIPPLRDRNEDVLLLAHYFLEKHRREGSKVVGVEEDALAMLAEHAWPGNVRELENTIESALALAPGPRLRCADLRPTSRAVPARAGGPGSSIPLSLAAYEKAALKRALDETDGDAIAAARRLGIGRSTLYRKLARHGISVQRSPRTGRDEGPAGVGPTRSIG
jgi:two-component system response regulator HydG